MASLEELRREALFRKCARDEVWFLEHFWHIRHPAQGKILFKLRDAQAEGLAHWKANRYSLTLKARQIGWSTLVGAHQFWLAFFYPDKQIIDISRTERESIDLLDKSWYGYDNLPEWLKERGPRLLGRHMQRMSFGNGSSIVSMPSASDPARGKSASLIVVDEWAFLPNPEDAWASIEPVADIGGQIIGLSTANGSGNFFHTLWVGATTGANKFSAQFHPWWAATNRDEAWYEQQKAALPPWQLAQEYPSNPEEAFIKSGNPYFDVDLLIGMRQHTEPPRRGRLVAAEGRGNYLFQGEANGALRVWREPTSVGKYCIGADVAEGLEWGDFSSAHVIDVRTGEVVAAWHGHIDPDLYGSEILAALGWWYNTALVGVESNNHGLTTLVALQSARYPSIYYRMTVDQRTQKESRRLGWRTQVNTKPLMLDALHTALRDGTLRLFDEQTLAELITFVREPDTGKTHGSPFDDRVISLAVAVMMIEHAWAAEYQPDERAPEWSFEWWKQQAASADAPGPWLVGAGSSR